MSWYHHVDFGLALKLFSNVSLREPDVCDLAWSEELSGFESVGGGSAQLSSGANYYDISVFSSDVRMMALRFSVECQVVFQEMPGHIVRSTVQVRPVGDRYGYVIVTAPVGCAFLAVNATQDGRMDYAMLTDLSG